MLAELPGLPTGARFIAYQAHERGNGSGYPRNRTRRQIHRFAQVVAIADAYAAMTSTRPYRPATSPYEAVTRLLYEGTEERFDRELLRAFLDTVALFPIGSRVELSDGTAARVLRANPGLHTRPVVEEVTADFHPTGNVLDLSEENAPCVVRAM